jgi:hypothetical protein
VDRRRPEILQAKGVSSTQKVRKVPKGKKARERSGQSGEKEGGKGRQQVRVSTNALAPSIEAHDAFGAAVMDLLLYKDPAYGDLLWRVCSPLPHPLGEIIYKVVRYNWKHDPKDLIKIAAWAELVWKGYYRESKVWTERQ